MRLELNIVHIEQVRFGETTLIDNGVLFVKKQELENLLLQDTRLRDIDIDLAHPGEKCRITWVSDAIEPRAKVGNTGIDFPGAVGSQGAIGRGSTCVLRGAAVLTSECLQSVEGSRSRASFGIVDMWGPGAEISPYGKTCNVVILPYPSAGTNLPEYQVAMKIAGLKTAVYLAKAGIDLAPDETEVYEMTPLADTNGNRADLPRVAYIFQVFTNQELPLPGDPVFYGDNVDGIVPTIVHPNEIFDGALTTRTIDTFLIQNHPILRELYRNHGKSLNFAGVIIVRAPNNANDIERAANIAANQAELLGADGVILTKYGGGAPEITMAAMAQKCEQRGIKTVLGIQHAGLDTAEITLKPSTIFSDIPEVDAVVSFGDGTGTGGPNITLPAAERVIGLNSERMSGELVRRVNQIRGATSLIGNSRLRAVRY